MAGSIPEASYSTGDALQQMGQMDGFDPQQMQQMQQAFIAKASGAIPPHAVGDSGLAGMPQVDPTMLQAYMQMAQYLQQGFQQQGLAAAGAVPGLPPMPFPGMPPTPYPSQMPMEPAVSVSVEGMKFSYQLTSDDLNKVFSRYGKVKNIRVDEAGSSAVIFFHNVQDAQASMNDLNGKVLNGLEGTLRIQWQTMPTVPPPYPTMPFHNWFPPAGGATWPTALAPGAAGTEPTPPASSAAAAVAMDVAKSPSTKSVRKYTCRFIIGIENDKEFQVARRIIGAKGVNMKRIFKQTEAKLRLRGKGSGYFEGAGQKESSEPLQLCISCTNPEGYKCAVNQVEELLKRQYDEYKAFCRDTGRPVPELQINLSENQLVYSRAPPLFVAGVVVCNTANETSSGGDGGASPKDKGKRGRRSRTKGGREGKPSPTGELERGDPGPNAPPVEEIEKMIDDRNEARRACNFAEADRIRESLVARGVALMDEPGGRGRGAEVTTWRYWRD